MPSIGRGAAFAATPPARDFAVDRPDPAPAGDAWNVPLAGFPPMTVGGDKVIYERPRKPSQIVKVHRPGHVGRAAGLWRLWSVAPHRTLIRQYRAFLDAMLLAPDLGWPPPLAQPRGLVLTDFGLGQLYQKIRDHAGRPATTLGRLHADGLLGPDLLGPLNAFVSDVYAFNIVVGGRDAGSHDIVLETRRGRRRFVLIDGFGATGPVPIRRWSRRANARALDALFGRLGCRIGLAWDRSARQFRSASSAPAPSYDDPTNGAWIIALDGARQLASGAEKEIFERPGKPSQIVKVYRDDYAGRIAASREPKVVLRRLRAIGPHKNLLRQYRAYLDAMLLAPALGRPAPLAHPRGLVLTDRGLGQLYQKVRNAKGDLAPTLGSIVHGGDLDAPILAALNDFVADVFAFNIVLTDNNANNLVLETRKGRSRFVLIDGFGIRTLVPTRRWFPGVNARALERVFARMGAKIGLPWDAAARRFCLPVRPARPADTPI